MSTLTETRPAAVAWLGYGGLLPFVGTALLCWYEPNHRSFWLQMLLSYGAVILSFVGALHWGFAMVHPDRANLGVGGMYVWSILPALVGWIAVLAAPGMGTALLLVGFLAHFRQDQRLARVLSLPAWYLPLRLQLTAVASLCLGAVYFLGQAVSPAAFSA